jgi:long-chain fatty acid transport protein
MSTPRAFRLALPALATLAALPVLALARPARAGGFMADQFGSDMGNPAMGNAYSVYFNPGAMAGVKGSDLTLDGIVVARSLTFNRAQSALSPSCNASSPTCTIANDPTYQTVNTGKATLFNVLGAPYLGFVTDFGGSNARLGVAGYVPFGGNVSWDKLSAFQNYPGAPGAYDGPQRWASISTSFLSLYGTVAFAYRIEAAHLGIGVSASVIRSSVQDTRAKTPDGSDDTVENGNISEGRAYLNVSGIQVGAAAGLYWEPSHDLRLGLSYTSQPNFGTMRLSGTYQFQSPQTTIPQQNIDFLQAYPDVIRLGATWRVAPDAELRLDGSYQRWSVFNRQCVVATGQDCNLDANGTPVGYGNAANQPIQNVPRNFQDTFKVRFGGAYWVAASTQIFASGSFETSAVPSAYEDPLVFDSQHIAGTLGLRYGFTKHLYGMAAYTYTYFLPVTVTNSAYSTYKSISTSPSENGSYTYSFYGADLALSYVF